MMSKGIYKRVFACLLALLMVFSLIPTSAYSIDMQSTEYAVTKDVTPLLTKIELEGVDCDENGNYYVDAKQAYKIKLTVKENEDLEMDMTDSIRLQLPAGIEAVDESNVIDIGVLDGYYKSIFHSYTIQDNVLTITWNKESEYFEDLLRAHFVEFEFYIQAAFDGSQDEVEFGDGVDTVIKVDNTGSITFNKKMSGLKSDVTLSDEKKQAMKFELRNGNDEVVKSFTYADMESGSITLGGMPPGNYTVVETSHPEFPNHTFDVKDSVTSTSGTLEIGGLLNLELSNDYEYQTGNLILNKSIDCINWDKSETVSDYIKKNISFVIQGPYGYKQTIPYTDFNNGKLELQGLEVGEYTITEQNKVAGYTWTYKIDNRATDTPSTTTKVTNGGTASVDFENKYVQQTGNLKIKKTAAGADVPANAEFRVTFPDGTKQIIKYSDMNGGEYTFKNVPLGTYKVEEIRDTAKVAKYALTVTGEGNVNLSKANETKTATIHNVYDPYGSLKISKEISGDLNAKNMTDAQKKAIKFSVYDSNNKLIKTLTYADILNGNDTISNLPFGQYTVKETASAISGYTVVTVPSNKVVGGTVDSTDKATTVTFKNTYKKESYKLTVNKEFGADSAYNQSNLPEKFKTGTTYTVKTKNGTLIKSCSYEDLASTMNELVLSGPGPYIITESNPSVDGVNISTAVSKDGGENYNEGKSIEITLENHKPATVTFKNTYKLYGEIEGDKTVNGLTSYDEAALKDRITFTVYQKVNGEFKVYSSNVTLAQLEAGFEVPIGEYYVVENEKELTVPGYIGPSVTTQVNNGAVNSEKYTDSFTVESGGSVIVHFTNGYTPDSDRGTLGLEKKVSGLSGVTGTVALTGNLSIKNADGKLLYDAISFKVEEKIGNTWYEFGTFTLKDVLDGGISLRPGHYRLTEKNAAMPGYSLNIQYSLDGNPVDSNQNQVEFDIEEKETLTIDVHNAYIALGNLKITKAIVGGVTLTPEERSAIKFEVTGPYNFHKTFTLADIYNSKTGTYETIYKNIPVGEYTVKEVAEDTANYKVTVSSNPQNGKVTVEYGKTATAEFTNTYTRKVGSLTVRKQMDGDYPESFTLEQKQAMTFTVKNDNNAVVGSATYDKFEDGAYTFTNLPTGTYTVEETIGSVLRDYYSITIDGNKKSADVIADDDVEVNIINEFVETGSLKLNKTFAGARISEELKDTLKFQYWMVDQDGQKIGEKKTISYSDFVDGSYTVKNLLPGSYVVEELDDTTGYVRSTTVSVNNGEVANATSANVDISFGNTAEVTFNNTYSEISSIVITKTISGALASSMEDAQKKAIKFTVVDGEGKAVCDSFTYYEMTDGAKTIHNLKPGIYTVTEEVTDPTAFNGYDCKTTYQVPASNAVSGTTATFTAVHGSNTVAFNNDYSRIEPLKVEKSSSDTYVGLVSKDDMMFPVWKFDLVISNLNPLTTEDGTTELTDNFDEMHADWFRLATKEELQELGISKNTYLTSLVDGKAAPVAVYDESTNKITITGIKDSTADKCRFTYYLIVKDAEILAGMNAAGADGANGVSHEFKNTVEYHPMPYLDDVVTTDAEYEYAFTAVDKDITNVDADGNLYEMINGNKVMVNHADYSVTINPEGVSIGDQPTILAIDEFSENQTVLLSSVTTTPSDNVSYKLDNQAKKIEFTIPNATPVTISYRVMIEESDEAQVTLKNDITLLGFVDSVEQEATRSMGGAGGGAVYSMKLIKVDDLDNSKPLEGVPFSLYDGETDSKLTTKNTDANGQISFKYWGDMSSFVLDHEYYLIEESTIVGYHKKNEKIWFKISKDETPGIDEGGMNILRNGGELIVTNEPVVANLAVTKNFNDWSKQDSFTFKLKAVDNAPMPAEGSDVVVTTKENPTAGFGMIRYNVGDIDFEANETLIYRYTIQEIVNPEDMIDGVYYDTTEHPVTVQITDDDEDGVREITVIYDEDQSSLTVTNKYETVEVSGSKDWQDADNQDGKRPIEIIINLLKNGTVIDTRTVTEADGWSWTFSNLPKYESGRELTYSITEEPVEHYDTSYDGYNVINQHFPETVDVSGSKDWQDADNQDGMRPAEIIINLMKDGEVIDSKVVTEADGWCWTFSNLPKYESGEEVVYSITEEAVEAYTTSYDGYNVINQHTPETVDISGSKDWQDADNQDGKRPEEIIINLMKDGKVIDSKVVTEADDWSWTFSDLPKYEAGQEIVYTITEKPVKDYTTAYNGYDVINQHFPETVTVSGNKDWQDADNQDGKRPEEIIINLLKDGEVIDRKVVTEADDWSWIFSNLPKYEDGKELVYSITEEPVEGYVTSYDGYNVINAYTPETVDISGSKEWKDADNQDGKRPEEIIINLLKNGKVIDTKTVTEADDWSWTFSDLPKYEGGKEIVYSISEKPVKDYLATYDGYNVINDYTPEKSHIYVTKIWEDENNYDELRPKRIKVALLANGEMTGMTLELNAENEWRGTFANLDVYRDGKEIVYTVEEQKVPKGYTSAISGTADEGFVITNTHPVHKEPVHKNPVHKNPIPKTGDSSNILLWEMLMIVNGSALAAMLFFKRRKKAE